MLSLFITDTLCYFALLRDFRKIMPYALCTISVSQYSFQHSTTVLLRQGVAPFFYHRKIIYNRSLLYQKGGNPQTAGCTCQEEAGHAIRRSFLFHFLFLFCSIYHEKADTHTFVGVCFHFTGAAQSSLCRPLLCPPPPG